MSRDERSDLPRDEREELPMVDRLSGETRAVTESPRVDWDGVDAKLFARIDADARERAKRRASGRVVWPVVGVLAAAAAVALFMRGTDAPVLDAPSAQVEPAAGMIVARDGDGDVLVDGRPATAGTSVGARAVVETRGHARVLVERAGAAGSATAFWVEAESRVVMKQTRGALVVALERGALEAKVAPESTFAVDLGGSRVTAHAAHVRVARDGARVTLDLNDGVVAIGAPPHAPSRATGGGPANVAAPAHAEFSADDAIATLTIDRAPSAVRPAVAFAIPVAAAPEPNAPAAVAAAPQAPAPTARGVAPAPPTAPKPSATAPEPAPDPNADATIARAVRACIAGRPPAPGVMLDVSTVIDVRLHDDGTVALVKFAPPLAPDTQACATAAIFGVRFAHDGAASIPVDYHFE